MTLLHEDVARAKFPAVVQAIAAVARVDASFTLVENHFPFVLLHVRDVAGNACLGLRVDCSNFPHRALDITPYDLSFRRTLPPEQVPGLADAAGRVHVMGVNGKPASWFCVIGTDQYHTFYADAVPWESVRHLPTNGPGPVVQACIGLIDRARLKTINDPGIPFPFDPLRKT